MPLSTVAFLALFIAGFASFACTLMVVSVGQALSERKASKRARRPAASSGIAVQPTRSGARMG